MMIPEQEETNDEIEEEPTTPIHVQEDTGVIRLLIDVDEALHKFEMEILRGKKLIINPKLNKRRYKDIFEGKQVCNELGVREILSTLRGRVTSITRLTYKEDEEIYKDMFQFHMTLIELFTTRSDEWEMDEAIVKPVLEACLNFAEDIVFSARKGFTAINIRSTYNRSEVERTDSNTSPQGIVSRIKRKF